MSPQEIRARGLLPARIPAAATCETGDWRAGIPEPRNRRNPQRRKSRDLRRFDVDFDLPDRFTPEFPPPIFLTTHPELGDVSHGQLLTIKNYYGLMVGILTPVQIEGSAHAADALPTGRVQPDRGSQER